MAPASPTPAASARSAVPPSCTGWRRWMLALMSLAFMVFSMEGAIIDACEVRENVARVTQSNAAPSAVDSHVHERAHASSSSSKGQSERMHVCHCAHAHVSTRVPQAAVVPAAASVVITATRPMRADQVQGRERPAPPVPPPLA